MTVLDALSHLISPRVCRICGCSLTSSEEYICLSCDLQLPRTHIHKQPFNTIHRRLGHNCHIDRAAGWFTYRRGTPYAALLVDAKYGNLPRIDRVLGAKCAHELALDNFFADIDAIVPMPMHWWKQFRRGYNQAQEICLGIESVTGLPCNDALRAVRSHGVQSRHKRNKRFSAIAGTMELRHDADITGKHILIVDDIITSGASLVEAIRAVSIGNPSAISVLCLGLTAEDT